MTMRQLFAAHQQESSMSHNTELLIKLDAALKPILFAAESVAHLRGMEREILPSVDAVREIIRSLHHAALNQAIDILNTEFCRLGQGSMGADEIAVLSDENSAFDFLDGCENLPDHIIAEVRDLLITHFEDQK